MALELMLKNQFPLVTKLQLGNAAVFEAPLYRLTTARRHPGFGADEAELRGQVRDQAGTWSRGEESQQGERQVRLSSCPKLNLGHEGK